MLKKVVQVLPIVLILVLVVALQADAWSPKFQDVSEADLGNKARNIGMALVGVLSGLFTIVFIGSVIWTSKKLALGSTNPQARAEAMSGYLWIMVSGILAFAAATLAGAAYWISTR